MRRTTVTVAGTRYDLAQPSDADQLQHAITDTFPQGGGFIALTLVGNRAIRVLVSPTLPTSIETVEIPDDIRDTGDTEFPRFEHDQFDPAHPQDHS